MRFQITLFAAFISILLTACGGDPGGHNPSDGIWTISYLPGQTGPNTTCSVPTSSITLNNGSGTITLTETCIVDTVDSTGNITSTKTVTTSLLTAVDITSGLKAIINGQDYSGSCVSPNGCSAQPTSGSGTDSITMIR